MGRGQGAGKREWGGSRQPAAHGAGQEEFGDAARAKMPRLLQELREDCAKPPPPGPAIIQARKRRFFGHKNGRKRDSKTAGLQPQKRREMYLAYWQYARLPYWQYARLAYWQYAWDVSCGNCSRRAAAIRPRKRRLLRAECGARSGREFRGSRLGERRARRRPAWRFSRQIWPSIAPQTFP